MRLGAILRKWRAVQEISTRTLAAEIGISAATLSRIERDEDMDGKTLAKILNWLTGETEASE